eukprot:236356-Alexandrium_andersonii.AAC.1
MASPYKSPCCDIQQPDSGLPGACCFSVLLWTPPRNPLGTSPPNQPDVVRFRISARSGAGHTL